MKKRLSFLTAAVLALSVLASGCANQEAYDFYADVQAASADVKSVEMSYNMNINTTMGDITVPMKVTGQAQTVYVSKTKTNMKMSMDMSLLGEQVAVKMYMKDNTMYYDAGEDLQFKTSLAVPDTTSLSGLTFDSLGISEDLIKSAELSKIQGGKQLAVTVDGAAAMDSIMNMMTLAENMGAVDASVFDDSGFAISDVRYIMTANKQNQLQSERILFTMVLSDSSTDEPVSVEFDMYVVYTAYDRISKVNFPDGLSSYKALDAA